LHLTFAILEDIEPFASVAWLNFPGVHAEVLWQFSHTVPIFAALCFGFAEASYFALWQE
jgi:hypothetical protein